jgi:hypothetical protein
VSRRRSPARSRADDVVLDAFAVADRLADELEALETR